MKDQQFSPWFWWKNTNDFWFIWLVWGSDCIVFVSKWDALFMWEIQICDIQVNPSLHPSWHFLAFKCVQCWPISSCKLANVLWSFLSDKAQERQIELEQAAIFSVVRAMGDNTMSRPVSYIISCLKKIDCEDFAFLQSSDVFQLEMPAAHQQQRQALCSRMPMTGIFSRQLAAAPCPSLQWEPFERDTCKYISCVSVMGSHTDRRDNSGGQLRIRLSGLGDKNYKSKADSI